MPDLEFSLTTHQGFYKIIYMDSGVGQVLACCRAHDGSRFLDHEPKLDYVAGFSHGQNLAADLQLGVTGSVVDRYRELFLDESIRQTDLEHPRDSLMPRVEATIRLWNGNEMQVVFRSDGSAWCIRQNPYVERQARLRYSGTEDFSGILIGWSGDHPWQPFRHNIDACRIIEDAARLRRWPHLKQDIDADYAAYFWEEVNDGLMYSWFRTKDDMADQPLRLRAGNEESLIRLMADLVRLDDHLWLQDVSRVRPAVLSGDRTIKPGIQLYHRDTLLLSSNIREAMVLLALWFYPTGFKTRIGENPVEIDCWYDAHRKLISIEALVERPTASERLEALDNILAWIEQTGVDLEPLLPC